MRRPAGLQEVFQHVVEFFVVVDEWGVAVAFEFFEAEFVAWLRLQVAGARLRLGLVHEEQGLIRLHRHAAVQEMGGVGIRVSPASNAHSKSRV